MVKMTPHLRCFFLLWMITGLLRFTRNDKGVAGLLRFTRNDKGVTGLPRCVCGDKGVLSFFFLSLRWECNDRRNPDDVYADYWIASFHSQ